MDGYGPASYGDAMADVYDEWYAELPQLTASRRGASSPWPEGGTVLELGVGTGRLALPLAARGVPVFGVEVSPAMVERMRAKRGAGRVTITLGDMAGNEPAVRSRSCSRRSTRFSASTQSRRRLTASHRWPPASTPDGALCRSRRSCPGGRRADRQSGHPQPGRRPGGARGVAIRPRRTDRRGPLRRADRARRRSPATVAHPMGHTRAARRLRAVPPATARVALVGLGRRPSVRPRTEAPITCRCGDAVTAVTSLRRAAPTRPPDPACGGYVPIVRASEARRRWRRMSGAKRPLPRHSLSQR